MCVAKVIEIIIEMLKIRRHKKLYLFNVSTGKLRDVFHGEHMNFQRRMFPIKKQRKTQVWKLKPDKFKLWKKSPTLWAINNDNQITEKKLVLWVLCLLLIKKGRYQVVKWKLLDPNICKNLTTLKPRNCSGKKTVRKDCWDRNEDSHSQYSDLLDHTTFHNTVVKNVELPIMI